MSKEKRNKVSVGLIRGNRKISNSPQVDIKLFEEKLKKGALKHKIVDPIQVISRLDHPEYFKYDGDDVRISPRAKLKFADSSKLGDLPKGVFKKKLSAQAVKPKSSKEEKSRRRKK